jgi:hypothetical protein
VEVKATLKYAGNGTSLQENRLERLAGVSFPERKSHCRTFAFWPDCWFSV